MTKGAPQASKAQPLISGPSSASPAGASSTRMSPDVAAIAEGKGGNEREKKERERTQGKLQFEISREILLLRPSLLFSSPLSVNSHSAALAGQADRGTVATAAECKPGEKVAFSVESMFNIFYSDLHYFLSDF